MLVYITYNVCIPFIYYNKSALVICLLSNVKRDIVVLYHMTYLGVHGYNEQYNEIHKKNWPEDWNVDACK